VKRTFIRWFRSLRYAYEGIAYALNTQPNMKFHFCAAFVALISALFFQLGRLEILFILLAVTLVIMAELVNTGIEKAVDLAMPDRHPLAKIAKDTAAAAVLVSAAFAVVVGVLVFYEPVAGLILHRGIAGRTVSVHAAAIYAALVLLSVIVAETRFSRRKTLRPSLWMAASFSISTLMALLTDQPLIALLSYSLSIVSFILLYLRRNRTLPALLFGSCIGVAVTLLAFYLQHLYLLIP
jgi:diacylglycerol kinase